MPQPYDRILGTQNPSLMLALSTDPTKFLTEKAKDATQLPDVKVEDKAYTALKLGGADDMSTMTLLIDPTTHLLKRATLDVSKMMEQRGASDVKSAQVVIDYSSVVPNGALKAEQFAWSPPAQAKDATTEPAAGEEQAASSELEGKAAPSFTLKNLEGKDVALEAHKGKVVILDFWATWCPPCREGLPHVDKVYQDFKDKGVVAFAVDLQEAKDVVSKFVEDHKLTLPALLDSTGSVAQAYKVEGIPQTVVVGKDGKVKKVFVGLGPNSEQMLADAVNAAVAEK